MDLSGRKHGITFARTEFERLDGISPYTFQKQRLILPNGDPIILTIRFSPLQYGWFITELSYAPTDFLIKGARVTTTPNMLHQQRNLVPFGLGCFTKDNQEPTQIEDFSSGYAQLYLLSEEEVLSWAAVLND